MKNLYLILLLIGFTITAFTQEKKISLKQQPVNKMQDREYLIAFLDTIWHKEQDPVRMRDTMIAKYGVESEHAQKYQQIYILNHIVNEKKYGNFLILMGGPTKQSLESMVIGL